MEQSGLRNVDEAANFLGKKPSTIRSWILKKKITYVHVGRNVHIRQADLDKVIEEGVVYPKQPLYKSKRKTAEVSGSRKAGSEGKKATI